MIPARESTHSKLKHFHSSRHLYTGSELCFGHVIRAKALTEILAFFRQPFNCLRGLNRFILH